MSAVVDTGPLVALLDAADDHHVRATQWLSRAPRPWSTCDAVLSEAFFLLRRARRGPAALCALLDRGALVAAYGMRSDERAICALLAKYDDVPMSLADACLVRMCELDRGARLVTFDADFDVYRIGRRRVPRL